MEPDFTGFSAGPELAHMPRRDTNRHLETETLFLKGTNMKNTLFGLTLIITTLAVTACGGSSNNGGPAVGPGPAIAPQAVPIDSNHQLANQLLSLQSPTKQQIQLIIDQATQNEDNEQRSLTNRYIRNHLRFECQGDLCVVQERTDRTE